MDVSLLVSTVDSFFPSYIYEDDEEEEEILTILVKSLAALKKKRCEISKVQGYVERIVPSFSAAEFKSHFRMLPSTFEIILTEIGGDLKRTVEGNEMIAANKQLLITLWRLAAPDLYRSIHTRFGVSKATAIRAVRRVTYALWLLAPKVIQWPSEEKVEAIMYGFSQVSAFPRTIGAIDGMHINIPAPKENPEAYVNRKGHHSIQAQVVCDHMRIFTHVYVGNVGSVHDARVFRLSAVQNYVNEPSRFPNDTHLIGDAAYPLSKRLMVPYTDNGHLSDRQKNFNYCLSSSRMVIERAIELLRIRWRSLLHYLAVGCVERVSYHFMACCVLHNSCLMNNDEIDAILVGNLEIPHHGEALELQERGEAGLKRNLICQSLEMRVV